MSTFSDAYRARRNLDRTPSQDQCRRWSQLQPEPLSVKFVTVWWRKLKAARVSFNVVVPLDVILRTKIATSSPRCLSGGPRRCPRRLKPKHPSPSHVFKEPPPPRTKARSLFPFQALPLLRMELRTWM